MPKRKALTKKTRFEVFKRDKFTCQYCGAKAPEVVLQVDHIMPVAGGGTNDILNLITSCQACNAGKKAIPLDVQDALNAKRNQLETLQERREQLEMLMQWHKGLLELDKSIAEEVNEYWHMLTDTTLSEYGMKQILRWVDKFGLEEVLVCMNTSVSQYVTAGTATPSGRKTRETQVNKAFDYIPRIAANRIKLRENPELSEIFKMTSRIKATMQWNYTKLRTGAHGKLMFCYEKGLSIEELWNAIYSNETAEELDEALNMLLEEKSNA